MCAIYCDYVIVWLSMKHNGGNFLFWANCYAFWIIPAKFEVIGFWANICRKVLIIAVLDCTVKKLYIVLQGGENRFSIYVHSRPGFLFNKATTRSNHFLNRQVNDSIQVMVHNKNVLKLLMRVVNFGDLNLWLRPSSFLMLYLGYVWPL